MTQSEFLTQLRTIANALPIGGSATLPRDFLLTGVDAEEPQATTPPSAPDASRWITATQAAERLGVARSMLYKPWGRRFAKRVGTRALRYDLAAIEKHMRRAAL